VACGNLLSATLHSALSKIENPKWIPGLPHFSAYTFHHVKYNF
jgi:hypothetical protein